MLCSDACLRGIEIRDEAESEECRARCRVQKGCCIEDVRSVFGGGMEGKERASGQDKQCVRVESVTCAVL